MVMNEFLRERAGRNVRNVITRFLRVINGIFPLVVSENEEEYALVCVVATLHYVSVREG